MTEALEKFQETCQYYAEKKDVRFDFTEENAPTSREYSTDGGKKYDDTHEALGELVGIVENAFVYSSFYETVDTQVLIEETKKYNEEYKQALKANPQYQRTLVVKHEDLVTTLPEEQ